MTKILISNNNPEVSVANNGDKYPWVSPYVYCANNPLRYVDLDGREIRYTMTEDKEGNVHYEIYYTATLMVRDNTVDISLEQLEMIKKSVTKQIEESFTGSTEINGKEISWSAKGNVRIRIGSRPFPKDNIISIEQLGGKSGGRTKLFGRTQKIDTDVAISGNWFMIGVVGAHEFGHGAGLIHEDYINNLMYKNFSKGTKIEYYQIKMMYLLRNHLNRWIK